MVHKLFSLRPLGENEFFQVNLLTDWDYQFSCAIFSDRASYQTNDETSKIYIGSMLALYFHLIHVFKATYATNKRLFSADGVFLNSITGYKILQKHFHYNATHKSSFLMIEIEFNPDFIENERFFEGTSGQIKEDRLTTVTFLDQFPLYSHIRQRLSISSLTMHT